MVDGRTSCSIAAESRSAVSPFPSGRAWRKRSGGGYGWSSRTSSTWRAWCATRSGGDLNSQPIYESRMTIFPAPARRAAACAVRFRRGSLAAPVLAATTAACGRTADSAPPAATVVDSAGIEIVTSSGPAWAAGEGWTVDETPQVEIGMMEGANEYLLAGVRGAKRRGDGTIVVANGQTG